MPPAPASPPAAIAPAEALAQLLGRYDHEHMALDDVIAAQRLADALAIERRYLTELDAVPRAALDADGQLSYDLFRQAREQAIEGFTYPEELVPLKPFGSLPFRLAAAAAASGQRTLSAAELGAWPQAIDACAAWAEQARANLREGLSRGYTEPRPLIEHVLGPLEQLGKDQPDNPFYTPPKVLAGSVPGAERERLSRSYHDAVTQRLLPSLRALHEFLAKDYLPKARTSLSLTDLPLGPAWYAYRLKRATGSAVPAADLHRQGLAAVEKLKTRGLPAAPPARAAAELLSAYQQLEDSVAPKLVNLFETPAAPPMLPVAAVGYPLEAASAVSYLPVHAPFAPMLYVHAPAAGGHYSVADFLAVALPGDYWREHLRVNAAPETPRDMPLAYRRGWEMYAASLGEELGVYADDPARASWQARQLRCAAGLAVDTGIHTQGWTRDRALDYLRTQTMIEAAEAGEFVDAIVASPGDAAACELGASKFQQLRARAQQVLGVRFDFKEFHTRLLGAGAVPLDALEMRLKTWWETSR